ncbi:MAG TPA: 5'-deoxynucleotidase [Candidatus Gallacutalibacter stercoravium]|nr:5'-deoxynucleotidase [Candidatus Gallacutalibacter stercoravium]
MGGGRLAENNKEGLTTGGAFYAMLSRMKYINRWGLMRSTRPENISEHSLDTAVIAHALALLRNQRFGGHVDPSRVALLALFHDAAEIITGDMPTPVKYHSPALREAYREVEAAAQDRLLAMLPEDLRPAYEPLLCPDEAEAPLWRLVKAADKISALIKCMEEKNMGNLEFEQAQVSLRRAIAEMELPEADCFVRQFLPAYGLTLDEQGATF